MKPVPVPCPKKKVITRYLRIRGADRYEGLTSGYPWMRDEVAIQVRAGSNEGYVVEVYSGSAVLFGAKVLTSIHDAWTLGGVLGEVFLERWERGQRLAWIKAMREMKKETAS